MWGIVFHQDLHHPKDEACRLAWWITWRRVAGEGSVVRSLPLVGGLVRQLAPAVHRWRQRREAAALARYFG
jgi:hypothetical protein